jgi:hypothetical protein
MTSKEFIFWLKGFTEGVHEFNVTPKQWDTLKEKLTEVKDDTSVSPFPFGVPNTTPNTHPFPTWQQPHYPNPLDNPYKITCTPGTTPPMTITTTPGTTGFVTIANPNIASFGTGSTGILNTYNPSTSTTYGYPSGSAWSYTNSTYNPPYTTGGTDEVVKPQDTKVSNENIE